MSEIQNSDLNVLECFDPLDLKRDFFNRYSRPPRSLDEMKNARYLILGHCTSSRFLEEIKRIGLVPDYRKERGINDGLQSDSDCIYLLVGLDKYFLNRAILHHGGEGLVICVKVELGLLEADENTIIPSYHKHLPSEEQLYVSLCGNQCKHKGPIKAEQILGIYLEEGTKIWPLI
jgi:hypothetical protein